MDRSEFLVRYYRWSCAEWEREIRGDLSRISALPSSSLRGAAIVLAKQPQATQHRIAMALTKRFHPEACKLLGVPTTQEEEVLLQGFQTERLRMVAPRASARIDARGLRRGLREALTGLTGTEPDPDYETGVEWRHVQRISGLRVLTYVDTGGRSRQAEYTQDLYEEDGSEVRRFISLAQWLGLGQTTFDCIPPGDEQQAVGQIVGLCRWFLDAIPSLVEIDGRTSGEPY